MIWFPRFDKFGYFHLNLSSHNLHSTKIYSEVTTQRYKLQLQKFNVADSLHLSQFLFEESTGLQYSDH